MGTIIKRMIKTSIIAIGIIAIIIISSCAYFQRRMPVEYIEIEDYEIQLASDYLKSQYQLCTTSRTNMEYKQIIEKDFNCSFYIYKEAFLPETVDGQCQILIRTITMNESINGFFYCSAFAHEMIHLTEYIAQENYVEFQTFKYLYEHYDPEFHNFGIQLALHCFAGGYPVEYNCSSQIIDYLWGIIGNNY